MLAMLIVFLVVFLLSAIPCLLICLVTGERMEVSE